MKMNSKQIKYHSELAKYLKKKKFTEEEAEETATKTVEMLIASGNDMLLKQPKMMGRMLVKELKRVERGDVVKRDDGSLFDTKTGQVYNEKK